ncbi:MAG TPA: GC-type dockerin domain-anchored protein [Phycisphaerales bacterium]|nr:GC-type dockerin domain-anchored protein [Phycisphaerales bacterium]
MYDAESRVLLREISLSGSPVDLAVSSNGRWAVTANLFEDSASLVDLDAGVESAVLAVGDAPMTATIVPGGGLALVGTGQSDELVAIDLATGAVVYRIDGLHFEWGVSVNSESFATGFYSTNELEIVSDALAIFADISRHRIGFVDLTVGEVEFIPCDRDPFQVAVASDGAVAVVSHPFSTGSLSVVDVASRTITRVIEIDDATLYPAVAINSVGTKAAIAIENDARIVNLLTGESSPNLGTGPAAAFLNIPDGQHVLAVGFRGSLLSYESETRVKNVNNAATAEIGAVAPVGQRAVMIERGFGEDMVVVNTDSTNGHLEELLPSGPGPEGDKPRAVAVAPDGSTIVAVNSVSDNVTVFDAGGASIRGHVPVGRRPGEAAISPDSAIAVVTSRDDPFVTVIDLATLAAENITISSGSDQVEISPDGEHAYIAVTSLDGVWRVNLAARAVEGPKLATGNMGGIGYHVSQYSGMSLSQSGDTLVTCDSFDNTITIIDPQSWAVIAAVDVGRVPTAATFSPEGARVFVSNRDDDTISVIERIGGAWGQTGIIAVGDRPFRSVLSPDGGTLYVMSTGANAIGVVDTAAQVMTDSIPVDYTPVQILSDPVRARLLVAQGEARFPAGGSDWAQFGALAIIDTSSNSVVESPCADHYVVDIAADAAFRVVAAAGIGGEAVELFGAVVCGPDLSGDGDVSAADVALFLAWWTSRDPRSDWDENGLLDSRDVIAFLSTWAAGC